MHALLCPNCGAPLPPEVTHQPFVTCAYCRTISNSAGQMLERHREPLENQATPPSSAWARQIWDQEREQARREQAWEGFKAALVANGEIRFEILRDATREHLSALGQSDALARVAMGLAHDFEREHGVTLAKDVICWWRLADGYMRAVRSLVTTDRFVLELPFFTANEYGPVHYQRELTVPLLQELARRDPAPPKRSFWKKLFG